MNFGDHQATSGKAGLRDGILCAEKGQWLGDWDVVCAIKIQVLWEIIYCQTSQILFSSEKKQQKRLQNHNMPFHFLQEIQLHCSLMGPSSFMCSFVDWKVVQCMTAFIGKNCKQGEMDILLHYLMELSHMNLMYTFRF